MKYSHTYTDLSPETRIGKILSHITPNSTVLECGSADGLVTKVLKEKLHCQVYIIEYDREAYEIALSYAQDGFCGDILDTAWMRQFKDIPFDYILLADILEHISEPELTLRRAVSLLKPDGMAIISIPNVTHNDILMKMHDDEWNYTDIGLLDNTHIHFWGAKNLDGLCEAAGLMVTEKAYAMGNNLETEQYVVLSPENEDMFEAIRRRKYGQVYQFLLFAQQSRYVVENEIVCKDNGPGEVYFEANLFYAAEGEDFSGDRRIPLRIPSSGAYSEEIALPAAPIKQLRFDPVEGARCVVTKMEAIMNGQPSAVIPWNGEKREYGYLFDDLDPQFLITLPDKSNGKLTISAAILPFFTEKAYSRFVLENDHNHCTERIKAMKDKVASTEAACAEAIKNTEAACEEKMKSTEAACAEAIKSMERACLERAKGTEAACDEKINKLFNRMNHMGSPGRMLKAYIKQRSALYYPLSILSLHMKPEVARQVKMIENSALFDALWYQKRNNEVFLRGIRPAVHYFLYGWKSNLDPSEGFSTSGYFAAHPEAKESNICPLVHYELHKSREKPPLEG